MEVKNFQNVNALQEHCSINFGQNLTLIYGGNGSGKSGVGRLLCNACFSRGEREILPNVHTSLYSESKAKATFIIEEDVGNVIEINYVMGDENEDLKCFSVFDSKSVLIHLDQSNNVNFTPAQIRIFDKVTDKISKLEEMLLNEKNAKRKNNPFKSMFLDNSTSSISVFCRNISASTDEAEFLSHANFDLKTDGEIVIVDLERQIDKKRKLDIPKRKSQLNSEKQNLKALKSTLENFLIHFSETKAQEVNQLIENIIEKKKIAETLSIQSFDDSIFNTIGSSEWKALISAAKELYDNEKDCK